MPPDDNKTCFYKLYLRLTLVIPVALLIGLSMFGPSLAAGVGQVAITLIDSAAFPDLTIYLAVTDIDNQPLNELHLDEITLYENDIQIKDSRLDSVNHPLLVGVVIDSSGSFASVEGGHSRLDYAREAAKQLINPASGRLMVTDEAAIFAFAKGQPVRLVDFTTDHNQAIEAGLNQVSTTGNEFTALFDLLRQAINDTSGRAGVRRRLLWVISDGTDETSGIELDRVIQQAIEANLLIYTVGLGSDLAPDQPKSAFLRRLAGETGGRYLWYQPTRPEAAQNLTIFLNELVAQRQGYVLHYISKLYEGNPELRVVVNRDRRVSEDKVTYKIPPLPPQVIIPNLQQSQEIVGQIRLEPVITHNQRPIEKVEYRVDGQLVYTALTAPWIFEWDTQPYATNTTIGTNHQLTLTVYDVGDYQAEINLTVGVRLPPPLLVTAIPTMPPTLIPSPTPTITPAPSPTPLPPPTVTPVSPPVELYIISGSALLIAFISLVILITLFIMIRQGKLTTARRIATDVAATLSGGRRSPNRKLEYWPTLVVLKGTNKNKIFRLEKESVYLGRDTQQADLIFNWDARVSRRHAKIKRVQNMFYLWDLHSANGTWVNEQRVSASLNNNDLSHAVPLTEGAIIQLGPNLELVFHTGSLISSDGQTNETDRFFKDTQTLPPHQSASARQIRPGGKS